MPPTLDLSFLRSRAALKRIAIVTLACAAIGVVYVLLAPKWYRSVLTVVPAKQQRGGGLSSLLGADLGGLSASMDSAMGGSDAPRIAAVLQSVAVSDAVIEKYDLRTRYGEKYEENARDELWRHCGVKTLPKPNLVEVGCEDKDPAFAQQMLAYMVEYGNQVFRRVNVSSASEEARFLEKRVAELRQQANDSATRVREFQEKHHIVDIDTQSKAVVSALAALNGQRMNKQLELEYARTFSSRDEAATQQLESQLSVMDEQLRNLEGPSAATPDSTEKKSRRGKAAGSGVFPAALEVPKLRAEFEGLYRDRKVTETSLVFALERLESARANEARNASTFLVLDPPSLPTRHSRPKRLPPVALFTIVGLAASLGFEWWRAGGFTALRVRGSSRTSSIRAAL